jgi:hypothetical protein
MQVACKASNYLAISSECLVIMNRVWNVVVYVAREIEGVSLGAKSFRGEGGLVCARMLFLR